MKRERKAQNEPEETGRGGKKNEISAPAEHDWILVKDRHQPVRGEGEGNAQ